MLFVHRVGYLVGATLYTLQAQGPTQDLCHHSSLFLVGRTEIARPSGPKRLCYSNNRHHNPDRTMTAPWAVPVPTDLHGM